MITEIESEEDKQLIKDIMEKGFRWLMFDDTVWKEETKETIEREIGQFRERGRRYKFRFSRIVMVGDGENVISLDTDGAGIWELEGLPRDIRVRFSEKFSDGVELTEGDLVEWMQETLTNKLQFMIDMEKI